MSKNWGRIWRVTIKSLHVLNENSPILPALPYAEVMTIEQTGWLPEGLHITFETELTFFQAYGYADIVIYNLNAPTSQDLIKYGMTCVLEAGYQDTGFGTVFIGTVFQPMWEKENGTDWKLTLHCIVGLLESSNNFIGHTVAGGVTQRDLVADMVGNGARYPIQLNMDDFPEKRVTRSTTYFGQPNDLLQYVADANERIMWFTHMAANIKALEGTTVPQWEYGIDNGLVGTPQQTQFGVSLRVLLNPNIHILDQVKLKQDVVIKQLSKIIGNYFSIITQDYTYTVSKIRHIGDSRGNDWYTDIVGCFNLGQLQSYF